MHGGIEPVACTMRFKSEDQIDLEEGLKALEAIKAGKEVPVPIEEALKRIGYKPRKKKARAKKK